MKHLYFFFFVLFSLSFQAQIINIPDANFKNALLDYDSIDTNQDNEIQVSEAEAVNELVLFNENIVNLEGIQYFINLISLHIENNLLTTIDISSLNSLNYLNIINNPITLLNVNGLMNLHEINISDTLISIFEGSNSGVRRFLCTNNSQIEYINLRNNYWGFSDPDLLYYAIYLQNNPNLISICTDDGEEDILVFSDYNTSGTVMVYNGVNCDIPVEVNMGVNDYNISKIKVFPNPTTSILNIQSELEINNIIITNTLGKKLLSSNNQTTIDVSSLSKGTYFITIETDNGKQTQKFIKN